MVLVARLNALLRSLLGGRPKCYAIILPSFALAAVLADCFCIVQLFTVWSGQRAKEMSSARLGARADRMWMMNNNDGGERVNDRAAAAAAVIE